MPDKTEESSAGKRFVMEGKELDKVTAFDTLFTTNHIQMCKVLLSYLPLSHQKLLAVYIKFSELIYTLSFFQNHPGAHLAGFCADASPFTGRDASGQNEADFPRMCDELMPYLSPAERDRVSQMKSMMQNMKNMQDMMEMMQMMKELFPEEGGDGGDGENNRDDDPGGGSGFSGDSGSDGGSGFNTNMLSALAGMTGMDIDPAMLSQVMQMFNN